MSAPKLAAVTASELPTLVPSRPRDRQRPAFGSAVFRVGFVPALLLFSLAPWLTFDRSIGWGLTSTTRPAATAIPNRAP